MGQAHLTQSVIAPSEFGLLYLPANASVIYFDSNAHDMGLMNAICLHIWSLLGNDGIVPEVHDDKYGLMVTPARHAWVIDMISALLDVTGLSLRELSKLLGIMNGDATCMDENDASKGNMPRTGKTRRIPSTLIAYVRAFARNIPFEPYWHMMIRGDNLPLDNESWQWLCGVYQDRLPVKGMHDEPMSVRKARRERREYAMILDDAYRASSRRLQDADMEIGLFEEVLTEQPRQRRSIRHDVGMDGLAVSSKRHDTDGLSEIRHMSDVIKKSYQSDSKI